MEYGRNNMKENDKQGKVEGSMEKGRSEEGRNEGSDEAKSIEHRRKQRTWKEGSMERSMLHTCMTPRNY